MHGMGLCLANKWSPGRSPLRWTAAFAARRRRRRRTKQSAESVLATSACAAPWPQSACGWL